MERLSITTNGRSVACRNLLLPSFLCKCKVFQWVYLYRCNPFPFHHYVIYNLNLRDKTLGLPGEQLERSVPFAMENVDKLNALCLTSPAESTPIFSDKYPSACNIYSSVLVSLQITDGPSARSKFPAEAAPPVQLSSVHNKRSEMEAFIVLMDEMNEADAVRWRETELASQNSVVSASNDNFFFDTAIAGEKRLFRLFFTYILSHNTPTLPFFSIVKHFSVLIFLCLNLLALTITLMLSSTPLT